MAAAAIALYDDIRLTTGETDPAAILAGVERGMAERFPTKFGKTEAPRGSNVELGLSLTGGKKEGFESLPKDAKDAFSRFVTKGVFTDDAKGRAQYYEDYSNA